MKDEERTRYFIDTAEFDEWIDWLNNSYHLKRLFTEENLKKPDELLCEWLADHLEKSSSEKLSSIFRGRQLNPYLWTKLFQRLTNIKSNSLEPYILSRWVDILMNHISKNLDQDLSSIARRCVEVKQFNSLMQVYDATAANLVQCSPTKHVYKINDDEWRTFLRKPWKIRAYQQ